MPVAPDPRRTDRTAPATLERMHVEQGRAYQEAVATVEAALGVSLPRFRGVELCVVGYKKPDDLGQAPYYRRFPGLTAKPYWDRSAWSPDASALLARFEAEYPALREEFEAAIPRARDAFRGQRTGYFGVVDRWLSYPLVTEEGEPVPEAFDAFPRLAQILGELARLELPCKTYFALMRPGVHLAEHCGGQNIALRMHLALRIPPGDAALRVAGVEQRWENGKQIFFDDTFVHEAWNRTEEDRYVLLMRIMHPELSRQERAAYFMIERAYRTSEAFLAAKAENDRQKAASPPPRRAKRKLSIVPSFGPPAVLQAVEQASIAILAEGRGAEGAAELGGDAGAWADELTGQVLAHVAPVRPIACAEGCAACCHLKVQVTPPEALHLAATLRATRSAAELQAIKDRVAAADRKTRGWTAAQRAAARIPCPLLEDGRCAAYDARPLACRGANAFDPAACDRLLGPPGGRPGVAHYPPQTQIAEAVRAGVALGAGRRMLDGRLLELNAALRFALEDPALGTAWTKGQTSFAPARDREVDTQR